MRHIRLCAAPVAALCLLAPLSAGAQSPAAGPRVSNAALAQRPTPRVDGHPSLEGYWFSGTGSIPPTQYDTTRDAKGDIEVKTVRNPSEPPAPTSATPGARPDYKDDLKAKTDDLFYHLNKTDKVYNCGQPGLPRVGAPQRIVQNSKEMVFLYADLAGMVWRLIPIGGKAPKGNDASYYGDAEAHWEGDSFIVHSTNFNQDTWLGGVGYVRSRQVRGDGEAHPRGRHHPVRRHGLRPRRPEEALDQADRDHASGEEQRDHRAVGLSPHGLRCLEGSTPTRPVPHLTL